MKEELVGNTQRGFSTLELMIALGIMTIVLTGAFSANVAAQYWSIASQTSNEGLYKAKTSLEDLRSLAKSDFYQASSSPFHSSIDMSDPRDAACLSGGLCYYIQNDISDLSSCSKFVTATVSWKPDRSPTTTTSLSTNLTNSSEAIALGGDCILNQPQGNFSINSVQLVGSLSFSPGKLFTGLDILHGTIYLTSSTTPFFSIYSKPTAIGINPTLLGTSAAPNIRLNDVDTVEDLSTGRTYAYAVEHSTTTQLAVFDVTDPANPSLVTEKKLVGQHPPTGSYPEGWRVFAYGNRVYVLTRETSGDELHIFNVNVPVQPAEVAISTEMNRTVNDLVIRDQKINGSVHRIGYFAGDADTKELGIFDLTGDSPIEVSSVDLPGNQDGKSLFLAGNILYFGRAQNLSGAELYAFDVSNPLSATPPGIVGQGEVGADVASLKVSGSYLFLGTSKSGEELQVWNSNYKNWNATSLNVGRFTSKSVANLVPRGIDIEGDWIYTVSQAAGTDALKIFYAP